MPIGVSIISSCMLLHARDSTADTSFSPTHQPLKSVHVRHSPTGEGDRLSQRGGRDKAGTKSSLFAQPLSEKVSWSDSAHLPGESDWLKHVI